MITSRAPTRISLAGGGTDLPSYYQKHGGYFLSAAIDKHMVVTANRQFKPTFRIGGYTTEEVQSLEDIKHNLYRETLKLYGIPPGIELVSICDVPSQAGLGTSGAFLSALINTLEIVTGREADRRTIAEKACKVEIDILKEHVGKQDQYASTYGGIAEYEISKNGRVTVRPLQLPDFVVKDLEKNIYLFYTNKQRKAGEILAEQDRKTRKDEGAVVDTLTWYKNQAKNLKEKLEDGNLNALGSLMRNYWERKKQYSNKMTTPFIDKCYRVAMDNGALGGKCMGAGGGGFLMFYHGGPSKERWKFVDEMESLGLKEMNFSFDMTGVTTLYDGGF